MELKLGEVESSYGTLSVMKGTYLATNGPTAVWLDREDGERIDMISVNLPDFGPLDKDHIWVSGWKINPVLKESLLKSGLFNELGIQVVVNVAFDLRADLWEIVS